MKKIGIFYGTTTGNTESAAYRIQELLGVDRAELYNVENAKAEDLGKYSNLILGTSTWGLGDLQDDFQTFLGKLKEVDLKDKTVALFGYGDAACYPDSFADGLGILYEAIVESGAKIIGQVSSSSYEFEASKAEVSDKFVGLVLDEENEGDLSEVRIRNWIASIEPNFR